jgi:hypothetical protein
MAQHLDQQSGTRSRNPWTRRVVFTPLLVPVAVVVLTIVIIIQQRSEDRRARVEIQRELSRIRAAGQPVTSQDLAMSYPDPPPDQDARLLLKPALDLLSITEAEETSKDLPFLSAPAPVGETPLDPAFLADAQVCVERNRAAFAAVPWEQLRGAWLGVTFTNGFTNLAIAPVSRINRLSKILCLNAITAAELQQPHEAALCLERALRVNRLYNNAVVTYCLSHLVIEHSACETLEWTLNRASLSDADLQSIASVLTVTNVGAVREAVINDRCFGVSTADLMRSGASQISQGIASPVGRLLKAYLARVVYEERDLVHYLDWSRRMVAFVEMPLPKAVPALADMSRQKAADRRRRPPSVLNPFSQNRSSLLREGFELDIGGRLSDEAQTVAYVRAAVTALGVERWRLAHDGQVPASLADLVPDILPATPGDPFDDQPWRYRRLAKGYVLYSVGPDFLDGGGAEKEADALGPGRRNITFTVRR